MAARVASAPPSASTQHWLVKHVNQFQPMQPQRVDPGWFHPSSLADPCDARLAFQFLGILGQQKHDARLQRVFDNGHSRDAAIKGYMQEVGLTVAAPKHAQRLSEDRHFCLDCGWHQEIQGGIRLEVPSRHICIPKWRIRGEYDDMLTGLDGRRRMLEIKTKDQALWEKLEEPDSSHLVQTNIYMAAAEVSDGIILYEGKSKQLLKAFDVPFDQQAWNALTQRIERILDKLANRADPMRTPGPFDEDCPFFQICHSRPSVFPELIARREAEVAKPDRGVAGDGAGQPLGC